METSKNKELVRSIKRAKKILPTADHVSNFADHVFNYIPTLMPSNVGTYNNENFIEGAHNKEMQNPSQFTKLLPGEKDRLVLSNISNCPRELSAQFNTAAGNAHIPLHKEIQISNSDNYNNNDTIPNQCGIENGDENNKMLRRLRRARKILSAADHITGHFTTEMSTNATDYNNENYIKGAFNHNSLDNNGKAMYGSSQSSSLLPQEKDKIVLNDISNCARKLTTKFDAAVQTGNACALLKSVNQGSNSDNHLINDVTPNQNAFGNDDQFSEDENGDANDFCQFNNLDGAFKYVYLRP